MASVRWGAEQRRSQGEASPKSLLCLAQIPSALAESQRAGSGNSSVCQTSHQGMEKHGIMDKLAIVWSN